MSGHMDEERIRQLLPDMEKAEHNGRMLEILFHPGQVLREEISDEFSQEDAIAFHVSPDRSVENRQSMHWIWHKKQEKENADG